ncbi:hypothetical protein M758_6G110800 [Ceratodon purpureus]|nr:hypothetical protein M758_6G110800 [Ceratodon purpureus]
MTSSLRLRAGGVVSQTEMAFLDYARPGSHFIRHESIASASSSSPSTSMPLHRLSCTARLPSSVAVSVSSPSRVSLGYGGGIRGGRARAASGSVQQEEIAAVGTISVGQYLVQGLREEMEDEIAVDVDGLKGFSYAAIFDGHAGDFSAKYLRDELYKECVTALEGGTLLESDDLEEAEEALERAFLQTDKRLVSRLETCTDVLEAESGSTATVIFARPDRLVLAYVGDSRVVISRNGKAEDLTSDHRPFGRDKKAFAETKRIQEAGGWVTHGRVCGSLSVSRAFGDIPFKTQKQKMLDSGVAEKRWTESFAAGKNVDGEWLTALPDTASMLLEEEVEFIILASDGLWDWLKSADAVAFVRKRLQKHGDVQRVSEEIAQEALNRGGQDNVSVIIVDFGRMKSDDGAAPGWKFW